MSFINSQFWLLCAFSFLSAPIAFYLLLSKNYEKPSRLILPLLLSVGSFCFFIKQAPFLTLHHLAAGELRWPFLLGFILTLFHGYVLTSLLLFRKSITCLKPEPQNSLKEEPPPQSIDRLEKCEEYFELTPWRSQRPYTSEAKEEPLTKNPHIKG